MRHTISPISSAARAISAAAPSATQVRNGQNAAGAVPRPWDAWLALRGLKTLSVRMREHEKNALGIARFLEKHKKVEKVYYPGLPGHPRRDLHFSQAAGAGSVISFDLQDEKAVPAFLNGLETILLAEKLGVRTVIDFSGCPGDSDDAKYPNWVTAPWPPDFLDILKWQWEKKVIPYWKKRAKLAEDHGVSQVLEKTQR